MAAHVPRWKDHPFKRFIPKDGQVPSMEDWQTWTISAVSKLDVMEELWFKDFAESLTIEDEEFHELGNHPTADVLTSTVFKKEVVTQAVAHGYQSWTAAQNVNPTNAANVLVNYVEIIARLKAILSQLSDTCAETFETVFVTELEV